MSILVFGTTGQVARELRGLAPEAVFLGRDQADLSDPEACAAAIGAAKPTSVINAAAYTAVDMAEAEEDLATTINGHAPGAMAHACADLGIPLVQISTDYVFDGQGGQAFVPGDTTAPLSAYGRSKLVGEEAVRASGAAHAILRTSWVFSRFDGNFLTGMLNLGSKLEKLSIIDDQIGGPTPASGIARACLKLAQGLQEDISKSGTYHYSGAPDASWFDFAHAIFDASGQGVALNRTQTAVFEADWRAKNPGKPRANRPLNSRLDCASLTSEFGITRPDWRAETQKIVKGLIS